MTDAIAGQAVTGPLPERSPAAPVAVAPPSPTERVVADLRQAFTKAGKEAMAGPAAGPKATAEDLALGRIALDDGGDLLSSLLVAFGNMTHGLPSFRPCWERPDGWWQDYDPERVRNQSQSLAQGVQAALDAGATAGVHLGAAGRRLFPRLTMERVPPETPPPPVPVPPPEIPPVRPPVAIDPLPPVTLPAAKAASATAEMGHRFGSDCATFFGAVPPAATGFFQSALRQVACGQVRAFDLTLTSVGAVRFGLDGKARAAEREAPSYEAVDGRPGNAARTRQDLEKARSVKARMAVDERGRATVRVTASCDEVQSLLSVSHLRSPGRELLRKLLHQPGATCNGRPVHLTDNDGLAAMRALATGIQLQRAAYLEAIRGDTHLSPAERLQRPPGEGGSWAPDLLKQMQAGTLSEDQAVLAAMARPALQQIIGKPPLVQLNRLGADGKPHPLLVRDAKTGRTVPLTLTASQGISLLASQTVATPPRRRAVGRAADTVDGGGVSAAALAATWQGQAGANPNALAVSGQSEPLDLGGPLGEGEDGAVIALLAHVDDGGDVAALRQSRGQIGSELRQVAGLCRQGAITGGGLTRQAQTGLAQAIEAFLAKPDAVTLGQSRQEIRRLAGGGASAGFARALIQRMQTGCRLEMALRALPAERQAPVSQP